MDRPVSGHSDVSLVLTVVATTQHRTGQDREERTGRRGQGREGREERTGG